VAVLNINVPHIRGYDFGVGVDRLSGTPMNQVVDAAASTPLPGQGGVQSFEVSRVYTTRDLQEKLGIDIEASYGCASFGAGASARFSYMKDSHVHSSALFMTVTATVHLADLSIDQSVLTEAARDVADRPDVFTARYGDMFCRACSRGGLFVGVMRIETYSSSDATEIEAALKGSYGFFSAEAKANFKSVTTEHRASVYCSIYSEGGPTLVIGDPSDPAILLENANTWMRALHEDPARYAKPYEWTLSPVTIAEGPLPLNPAQIQHCQDVLQHCALERTNLLDQLNRLEWINDHPERFDWADAVTHEQIRTAARNTQKDLDMVARCASSAINNPSEAVMPATFASRLLPPASYPSAAMPAPLPKQLPGPAIELVEVPRFVGQYWFDIEYAYRERDPSYMPYLFGFELAFTAGVTGTEDTKGYIYEQRPAGGSKAPKGSTIELIYYYTPSGGF
jgi:hypothetical protein